MLTNSKDFRTDSLVNGDSQVINFEKHGRTESSQTLGVVI